MGVLFKTLFIMLFLFQSRLLTAQNWHSTLYPENWAPGFSDTQGRFFHDFSFAGYRSGLEAIPNSTNNIVDVTKSPYNADKTGILRCHTDYSTSDRQSRRKWRWRGIFT